MYDNQIRVNVRMNYSVFRSLLFNIALMISFLYIIARIKPFREGFKSRPLFFAYFCLNASLLSILCVTFPLYKNNDLVFDIRCNPIIILGMVQGFPAAALGALISELYGMAVRGGLYGFGMVSNDVISAVLGGVFYSINRTRKGKSSILSSFTIPVLFCTSLIACIKDYLIYKYFVPAGSEFIHEMGGIIPAADFASIFIIGVVIKDNIRLFQHNRSLREDAVTDQLTGLKNYRYIVNKVYRLIEDEGKKYKYISFVMLDIDRFKNYNDTFGHIEGNNVLKRLSAILLDSVREGDIVARYGGEEFLIILKGVNIKGAYNIAERVRKNVYDMSANFSDSLNKTHITISAGISCYPVQGNDARELIRNADKALYCAKERGRNNVQIYDIEDTSFYSAAANEENRFSI